VDSRRPLCQRSAAGARPRVGRGARGQRCRRPAADRRHPGPGQAAVSARAGGRLVTLEANPGYAEVARANIESAGFGDLVELRVGPALDTLAQLAAEGEGPFDFIFIDADKQNTPQYFAWALEHSRPGSMIVADNVIRDGALIDPNSNDPAVEGGRGLHELLAADRASGRRVSATTIQTVGSKGYDGFTLALVAQA
jgi:predicted O-methyltransferase YrrM